MINSEVIKLLLNNFPNFMGLVFLSIVLYIINNQTGERLDRQFDVLVACLQAPR